MLTISSFCLTGKGPTTTTTLKAAYAAEVKKVQTELDNQRIQSTKLDSVEHKIRAVEQVRDLAPNPLSTDYYAYDGPSPNFT